MKKLLIFALPLLLASCGGTDTPPTPLIDYSNHLIAQYPNFGSNELARNSITDSIHAHAQSLVGTIPHDFEGIPFRFDKLAELNGKHGALFCATMHSDIESPTDTKKYIISSIYISVFSEVDNATASLLDANQTYTITGKVIDWDAKDFAKLSAPYELDALDFGTFFIDNATITPNPKP